MVSGDWVKSGETSIAITASIQPATGKDMLNVPEGKRANEIYAVFTSTEIQTIRHSIPTVPGTQPDQMEIFGHRCEAIHVEPWQNNVINHYRALFARMN
jgi:hypothetical protein